MLTPEIPDVDELVAPDPPEPDCPPAPPVPLAPAVLPALEVPAVPDEEVLPDDGPEADEPDEPDDDEPDEEKAILMMRGIALPPEAEALLRDPASESPKPGDPAFARAEYRIVARPADMIAAVAALTKKYDVRFARDGR